MASKLKLTDVVAPYTGDGDASEWWSRFKIVAKLKQYSEEDMVTIVPLLLGGPPFLVYKKMDDLDKINLSRVKDKILKAFSLSKLVVFDKLRDRTHKNEESVDAYYSDVNCLCGLAGINGAGVALAVGLPEKIGLQLRTIADATDEQLVAHARVLIEADVGIGDSLSWQ